MNHNKANWALTSMSMVRNPYEISVGKTDGETGGKETAGEA